MEFIEFRLLWEGGINRSDIVEQFGVSAPQASNDLSHYRETASKNIVYDLSAKCYHASEHFKPIFLRPDPDRYLSQLKLVADNLVSSDETWLSMLPSVDSIPIPHRRVDINILKKLINSVRDNRSIHIHYQSMNKKGLDATWRWITPHAFANDGLRWHVRAFCHVDRKFKDFILSRFLDIGDDDNPGSSAEQDKSWSETIDVMLVPNPAFSKAQRDVIAMDYEMKNGKLRIPVRKAVLYYFEKRLRLDVAEALKDPYEAPIVIENIEAFKAALKEA